MASLTIALIVKDVKFHLQMVIFELVCLAKLWSLILFGAVVLINFRLRICIARLLISLLLLSFSNLIVDRNSEFGETLVLVVSHANDELVALRFYLPRLTWVDRCFRLFKARKTRVSHFLIINIPITISSDQILTTAITI